MDLDDVRRKRMRLFGPTSADEESTSQPPSSTFPPTPLTKGTATTSIDGTDLATAALPLSNNNSSRRQKRKAMDEPGVFSTTPGDADKSDDAAAVREFASHARHALSVDCSCGSVKHDRLHVPCRFDTLMKEAQKDATTTNSLSIDERSLRVWVLLCGYDDTTKQNELPIPRITSQALTTRKRAPTTGTGTGMCIDRL